VIMVGIDEFLSIMIKDNITPREYTIMKLKEILPKDAHYAIDEIIESVVVPLFKYAHDDHCQCEKHRSRRFENK
jgi:hypothetical protein